MGLSDDLGKLDTFVETVTRKVAQYLGEVSKNLHTYIFFFQFDHWTRSKIKTDKLI